MSGRMGMILTSGYQVASSTNEPIKNQNVAQTFVPNSMKISSNYRKGKLTIDLYDLIHSKPCKGCN